MRGYASAVAGLVTGAVLVLLIAYVVYVGIQNNERIQQAQQFALSVERAKDETVITITSYDWNATTLLFTIILRNDGSRAVDVNGISFFADGEFVGKCGSGVTCSETNPDGTFVPGETITATFTWPYTPHRVTVAYWPAKTTVYPSGWLSGCLFRRMVTVTNTYGDLNDYQVRVVVPSTFDYSRAAPDGSDVRFTADDGSTELPSTVEEWNTVGDSVVWVRVPRVPVGESYVYMYYGCATKNPYTPQDVFLFFDDFETFTGWITYGSGLVTQDCNVSYSGACSAHKTTANDPNGAYKDISVPVGRNVLLEGYVDRNSGYLGGALDRVGLIDNDGNGYGFFFNHSNVRVGVDVRTNYSGSTSGSTAAYNIFDRFYRFELRILATGEVNGVAYDTNGLLLGYLAITDANYTQFTRVYIFGGYDYWVDYLRLRRYVEPEPVTSLGPEQHI